MTVGKWEMVVKDFTEAGCDEIKANDVCEVVACKGKSGATSVTGKPVKLRFALRHTDLYAFQFRPMWQADG